MVWNTSKALAALSVVYLAICLTGICTCALLHRPDYFASVENGSILTAANQLAENEVQNITVVEEQSSDDLPENTNRRHWDVQESSSEDESNES